MADTRTGFEQTVAISAAVRDTIPDVARSLVITDSLGWIIDNLPTDTDRAEFVDALTTVRERLDATADRHLEGIEDAIDLLASGEYDDDTTELDHDVSTAQGVAQTLRVVAQGIGDTARYTTMKTTGLPLPSPTDGGADIAAERASAGPSLAASGMSATRPVPMSEARAQGVPHGRTLTTGPAVGINPSRWTR